MSQHHATGCFGQMLRQYTRTALWWDDPEQAEVEIGLAAWKARQRYQPEFFCSEGRWVAGQVAHALQEARRQARKGLGTRRVRIPTLVSLEWMTDDEETHDEFLRCERAGPEEVTLRCLEIRRVREAIARLSPRDQGVIRRCYLDGLSLPEYAREIGRPLTTVGNWARWAKRNLRMLLEVQQERAALARLGER